MTQDVKSQLANWILAINLVVMLFPPIHLSFANGSAAMAMTYAFGSGVILVASMTFLRVLDGREEE